jgi:hypothetical protein
MKKLSLGFLVGWLIASQAFAGLPPPTAKGQNDTSAPPTFNLQVPNSQSTRVNGTTALLDTGNLNELANPGFDGGTTGWTASGGTFGTTPTAAFLGDGKLTGSWDSSGVNQTLTSTGVTITSGDGRSSQNYTASMRFKCATGTCTHKIQLYDGTNVLAESTITSSTSQFVRTSVTGPAPASGTVYLRILAVGADENGLYLDSGYLGRAEGFNMSQLSQSKLVGSLYFPVTASCTWDRTSTSIGAFTTTAACPGPTVEVSDTINIATTDADLPQFTMTNMPPGKYFIVTTLAAGQTTTGANDVWTLSDGTTTSGSAAEKNASNSQVTNVTILSAFNYTTAQSTKTFAVQASADTGTVSILNSASGRRLTFQVYYAPSSAEQAYRQDQLPASWSGYHFNDCSWASTGTSLADPADDASCTFTERQNRNFGTVTSYGSKKPGIAFTPNRAGRYWVCAQPIVSGSTTTTYTTVELSDTNSNVIGLSGAYGSNFQAAPVCGVYNASSTSAVTIRLRIAANTGTSTLNASGAAGGTSIEWAITSLDQSFPAPVLASSAVYLQYTGNGANAITANTTNLTWSTKVVDSHNAWNGTTFTAPRAGWYNIVGGVLGTATGNIFYLYKNGSAATMLNGSGATSARHGLIGAIYLTGGDTLTVREDGSDTLSNSATDHWISISSQGGAW